MVIGEWLLVIAWWLYGLLWFVPALPVNARIQQWMVDKIKEKGEVGYVLEEILINAGFEYHEPEVKKTLNS